MSKEELGGMDNVAAVAGSVDLVVDSERAAFAAAAAFLQLVTVPIVQAKAPQGAPLSSVNQTDANSVLASIVDAESSIEFGQLCAPSLRTIVARINGRSVAILLVYI